MRQSIILDEAIITMRKMMDIFNEDTSDEAMRHIIERCDAIGQKTKRSTSEIINQILKVVLQTDYSVSNVLTRIERYYE